MAGADNLVVVSAITASKDIELTGKVFLDTG